MTTQPAKHPGWPPTPPLQGRTDWSAASAPSAPASAEPPEAMVSAITVWHSNPQKMEKVQCDFCDVCSMMFFQCDLCSMFFSLYGMCLFCIGISLRSYSNSKPAGWLLRCSLASCPSRNALATSKNCGSNHHRKRRHTKLLCGV
jgi:hypothetical protein